MAGILLVEDDNDLRMMLKDALEKRKHIITEASNGREALNKFKSPVTDLVITDLLMPEQDGIGLIMELRKMQPGIKIIAISGGGKIGPSNYLNVAKTLGADAVFPKPFNLNSFIEEVEKLAGQ
ncbi:MAG: response regulator [Bacteroidales bacterium]|nr:response regulator [Bacteroidales bacterium]